MKSIPPTIAALLFAVLLFAQDTPPMPPPPPGFDWASTNTLTIKWDHIPERELFRAQDSAGNELHLFYRVWHSQVVNGPYIVVATTTNNLATISNLVLRSHYFYVTSVNPLLAGIESEPSDKVASLVEKVSLPTFVRR
jgi:hypothetical protein